MSHLDDVNMSYFEHLIGAFNYSFISCKASMIFFIHGIFPDCFVVTGSTMIKQLNDHLQKI